MLKNIKPKAKKYLLSLIIILLISSDFNYSQDVCEDESQVLLNDGICKFCVEGSYKVDNINVCKCDDPFVWNINNNTCSECPENHTPDESNICRTCPSGSTYKSFKLCDCGQEAYWNQELFNCICKENNKFYSYGYCDVCPKGAKTTFDGQGCECENKSIVLDFNSKKDCCSEDSIFNEELDLCECNDVNKVHNYLTGCSLCPIPYLRNGNNCICLDFYKSKWDNYRGECICPFKNQYFYENKCVFCSFDSYLYDNECLCYNKDMIYDYNTRECNICDPNSNKVLVNGKCEECGLFSRYDSNTNNCICESSLLEYNKDSNKCFCLDPNKIYLNGECKDCPINSYYLSETNECECDNENWNFKTNECGCSEGQIFDYYFKFCVCKGHNEILINNTCLSCPEYSVADYHNNTCICENDLIYDSTNNVCKCINDSYIYVNNKCICPNGTSYNYSLNKCACFQVHNGYNFVYHQISKKCACPTELENLYYDIELDTCKECPSNAITDPDNPYRCKCTDETLTWYKDKNNCLCDYNHYVRLTDKSCVKCPDDSSPLTNSCLCRLSNDPESGGHNFLWSETDNKCYCKNTYQIKYSSSECYSCPTNSGLNEATRKCNCYIASQNNNLIDNVLQCSSCHQYKKISYDNICLPCPEYSTYDTELSTCVCTNNLVYKRSENSCLCTDTNSILNSDNKCTPCPINSNRIIKTNHRCNCNIKNSTYNFSTNTCDCYKGFYKLNNGISESCYECPGPYNDTDEYGNCLCEFGKIFNKESGRCECNNLKNFIEYPKESNKCYECTTAAINNECTCSSEIYNMIYSIFYNKCICENNQIYYTNNYNEKTCVNCPEDILGRSSMILYDINSCLCIAPFKYNEVNNTCNCPEDNSIFINNICLQCPEGTSAIDYYTCSCNSLSMIFNANSTDSTKLCLPCPELSVYNSSNNTCDCKNLNSIWSKNTLSCLQCSQDKIAVDNQCVSCPRNNQYIKDNICIDCPLYSVVHHSYLFCTCNINNNEYHDLTDNLCAACPQDKFIHSSSNSCVVCNENEISVNGSCVPCLQNTVASENQLFCICKDNNYFDVETFACLTCPVGFIIIHEKNKCVTCNENEYYNTNNNECTLCPDNTYPSTDLLFCVCNNDIYENSVFNLSLQTCINCDDNSISYPEKNKCITCNTNEYLLNDTCMSCPENTVLAPLKKHCICDDNFYFNFIFDVQENSCIICNENSTAYKKDNKCISCSESQYIIDSTCYDCPDSLISSNNKLFCICDKSTNNHNSIFNIQSNLCLQCSKDNREISNLNTNNCDICPLTKVYYNNLPQDEFVFCSECPDNLLINKTSEFCLCDISTNSRFDLIEGVCVPCNENYTIDQTINQCVFNCDKTLQYLYENKCYDCPLDTVASQDNLFCICNEENKYFNVLNGMCEICSTVIDKQNNFCLECSDTQYFYNDKCIDCPTGLKSIESKLFCICEDNTKYHNVINNECLSCDYGYAVLLNTTNKNTNTCESICSQTQVYYNSICQTCPENSVISDDRLNCICNDNHYYFDLQTFICKLCDRNMFFDRLTNTCVECDTLLNILYNGNCLKCPHNTTNYKGLFCKCNENFYPRHTFDMNTFTCVECIDAYFDANKNKCVACDLSYNNQTQICSCNDHFVYNTLSYKCIECGTKEISINNICKPCSLREFSSLDNKCIKCPYNKQFNEDYLSLIQTSKVLNNLKNAENIFCKDCLKHQISNIEKTSCYDCPRFYIPNDVHKSCSLCHDIIPYTLLDYSVYKCKYCQNGQIFRIPKTYYENPRCIDCPFRHVSNKLDNTCIKCNTGYIADIESNECKLCPENYIQENNRCVKCPDCQTSIKDHNSYFFNKCIKQGKYCLNGKGVIECPLGYIIVDDLNCVSCYETYNNNNLFNDIKNAIYQIDNKCIDACPKGYYIGNNHNCISCGNSEHKNEDFKLKCNIDQCYSFDLIEFNFRRYYYRNVCHNFCPRDTGIIEVESKTNKKLLNTEDIEYVKNIAEKFPDKTYLNKYVFECYNCLDMGLLYYKNKCISRCPDGLKANKYNTCSQLTCNNIKCYNNSVCQLNKEYKPECVCTDSSFLPPDCKISIKNLVEVESYLINEINHVIDSEDFNEDTEKTLLSLVENNNYSDTFFVEKVAVIIIDGLDNYISKTLKDNEIITKNTTKLPDNFIPLVDKQIKQLNNFMNLSIKTVLKFLSLNKSSKYRNLQSQVNNKLTIKYLINNLENLIMRYTISDILKANEQNNYFKGNYFYYKIYFNKIYEDAEVYSKNANISLVNIMECLSKLSNKEYSQFAVVDTGYNSQVSIALLEEVLKEYPDKTQAEEIKLLLQDRLYQWYTVFYNNPINPIPMSLADKCNINYFNLYRLEEDNKLLLNYSKYLKFSDQNINIYSKEITELSNRCIPLYNNTYNTDIVYSERINIIEPYYVDCGKNCHLNKINNDSSVLCTCENYDNLNNSIEIYKRKENIIYNNATLESDIYMTYVLTECGNNIFNNYNLSKNSGFLLLISLFSISILSFILGFIIDYTYLFILNRTNKNITTFDNINYYYRIMYSNNFISRYSILQYLQFYTNLRTLKLKLLNKKYENNKNNNYLISNNEINVDASPFNILVKSELNENNNTLNNKYVQTEALSLKKQLHNKVEDNPNITKEINESTKHIKTKKLKKLKINSDTNNNNKYNRDSTYTDKKILLKALNENSYYKNFKLENSPSSNKLEENCFKFAIENFRKTLKNKKVIKGYRISGNKRHNKLVNNQYDIYYNYNTKLIIQYLIQVGEDEYIDYCHYKLSKYSNLYISKSDINYIENNVFYQLKLFKYPVIYLKYFIYSDILFSCFRNDLTMDNNVIRFLCFITTISSVLLSNALFITEGHISYLNSNFYHYVRYMLF